MIYMKKYGLIITLIAAALTAHAQYLEQNINSGHHQAIPTFTDPSHYSLTVVPVPEPTPYLMFGLGALVLAFGRWRASRSRNTRL
jgi:PEP-CTERM motif